MSALGEMRDDLETIHEMLPLSERESALADMIFDDYGEIAADMRSGSSWWGSKAIEAWNWLMVKQHFDDMVVETT